MVIRGRMLGVGVLSVAALFVVVAVGGATAMLHPLGPGDALQPGETHPLVPPLVVPPNRSYAPQPVGAVVRRADGVAIGQLATVPVGLQEVEAYLSGPLVWDEERISFAPLANLRYRGGDGTVEVLTMLPSAAAAQRSLGLGNTMVTLGTGERAWLDGSRVAFVRDGVIIVVSGNVTRDALLVLAASVVVK